MKALIVAYLMALTDAMFSGLDFINQFPTPDVSYSIVKQWYTAL